VVLSVILLSSFVLLLSSFRKDNKLFEALSVPASIVAILSPFFQLLMFGFFSIHYRLENNVFMAQNILAWSALLFTVFMTYLLIRDYRRGNIYPFNFRTMHRVIIALALWGMNVIFVIYDVIRIA
jgi:hypothetical protein